eukprot:CAMPEP_0170619708 /NCGR_PEP_ID=MMETSP0224-20130122/27660_1 /TAXON_ID=285029 /ORGANISM="Togula jolla, Strain CCCM 725" /LENGTH=97 /DNA_ID=CAMNT_0010945815 /DNA_START=115 /DNA_END=408 /DNA_ORIENTATION=-
MTNVGPVPRGRTRIAVAEKGVTKPEVLEQTCSLGGAGSVGSFYLGTQASSTRFNATGSFQSTLTARTLGATRTTSRAESASSLSALSSPPPSLLTQA